MHLSQVLLDVTYFRISFMHSVPQVVLSIRREINYIEVLIKIYVNFRKKTIYLHALEKSLLYLHLNMLRFQLLKEDSKENCQKKLVTHLRLNLMLEMCILVYTTVNKMKFKIKFFILMFSF